MPNEPQPAQCLRTAESQNMPPVFSRSAHFQPSGGILRVREIECDLPGPHNTLQMSCAPVAFGGGAVGSKGGKAFVQRGALSGPPWSVTCDLLWTSSNIQPNQEASAILVRHPASAFNYVAHRRKKHLLNCLKITKWMVMSGRPAFSVTTVKYSYHSNTLRKIIFQPLFQKWVLSCLF